MKAHSLRCSSSSDAYVPPTLMTNLQIMHTHIHILKCLSTWHCFKLWRDAGNICELLKCRQPCSCRQQLWKEDQGAGWICCFVKPVTHLPCCLTGLQKGMLNPLSQVLIQKGACAWLRLFTLHLMLCHSRTVSSIANRSDKT